MKKYVMIYENGGNVDIRFIQSDKDFESEGIKLGHSLWGDFVDDDLKDYLNETFEIDFEDGETFMIREIPEIFDFEKI